MWLHSEKDLNKNACELRTGEDYIVHWCPGQDSLKKKHPATDLNIQHDDPSNSAAGSK